MGEECIITEKDSRFPAISEPLCIGCGLCVTTCPKKALTLVKKTQETVPPGDEEELYDTIKADRKGRLGQALMLLKVLLRMRQ